MRKNPSQMIVTSFFHAVSYSDLCIDVLGEFAQGLRGEFVHWKASKRLTVDGDDCKSRTYIPPNTN